MDKHDNYTTGIGDHYNNMTYADTGSKIISSTNTVLFDPHTRHRFICNMWYKDDPKEEVLPACVIKAVTRPCWTKDGMFGSPWNPMEIKCYDPVSPSSSKILWDYLNNPRKFDMSIKLLDAKGGTIEEWSIKDAEIVQIDFGTLEWSATGEPIIIAATIISSNIELLK